jgi:hypothetical protein
MPTVERGISAPNSAVDAVDAVANVRVRGDDADVAAAADSNGCDAAAAAAKSVVTRRHMHCGR